MRVKRIRMISTQTYCTEIIETSPNGKLLNGANLKHKSKRELLPVSTLNHVLTYLSILH